MLYNEKCPICGTENKRLNLDETNGWFICEKCGNKVNTLKHYKTQKVANISSMSVDQMKKHFNIT